MDSTQEYESTKREKHRVWLWAATAAFGIFLVLAASSLARAYATYSGTSVDSSGTVRGWAVTDGTAPLGNMYHTAYVYTTLTSPNGRVSSTAPYWWQAMNSIRADVGLYYDPNDLGTYQLVSLHKAYCSFMGWFIPIGTRTGSNITVPYVLFTLQTSGTIPNDNAGKAEFNTRMGSTSLGTRYYPTPAYWGTGVQIKGVVWPNFFSDSITVRREVLDWMVYYNTVLVEQNAPPIRDDTSFPQLRDDYPQSGGSAGMVYDLDAPGIKKSGPPYQTIYRVRYNFRQWAVLNSRSLVVSPIDLYWYSRVSILHRETGDQLNTDVPGDNVAGVGRTNTTWDLHPQ